MNLQEKLLACQGELARLMLKKNMSVDFGRNSKFSYFEVGFLLKNLTPILQKNRLLMHFTSDVKDVTLNNPHVFFTTFLVLVDVDKPTDKITFATPAGGTVGREMGQTLGKVTTYSMRVLLQMVFLTHEADDLEQYTLDQEKKGSQTPVTAPVRAPDDSMLVRKQIKYTDKLGR